MKKYTSTILAILLLASVAVTWASTIVVGTLTTVNNTTAYSTTNTLPGFSPPAENYSITNAGLTATTALVINRQISVDGGTTWATVDTWSPAVTNPANVTWSTSPLVTNLLERLAIVTTNSVQLGITRN